MDIFVPIGSYKLTINYPLNCLSTPKEWEILKKYVKLLKSMLEWKHRTKNIVQNTFVKKRAKILFSWKFNILLPLFLCELVREEACSGKLTRRHDTIFEPLSSSSFPITLGIFLVSHENKFRLTSFMSECSGPICCLLLENYMCIIAPSN